MLKRIAMLGVALFLSISCHAETFSIVPLAGHPLPTLVNANEPTTAYYTVTNKTGKTLNGIHVAYLPTNVIQQAFGTAPNLCGNVFSLPPGGNCTLQLIITGAVTSTSTNPHQHLYVCMPGDTTCSGTAQPLNVSLSGWVDTGLPAGRGASLTSLMSRGNVVYTYGRGSNGYPAYWTYSNNAWTNTSPIPHAETGTNASITAFNPTANFIYLGVSGASEAWVFEYLTNGTSVDTELPTGTDQGLAPNYWGPLSNVQASMYDQTAGKLYVAGVGFPSATLPNSPNDFSLFGGRLYSYDGSSWSETEPSVSAGTSFSSYSSMALDKESNILYVAGYGLSLFTSPMIGRYSINDENWESTLIIFTADSSKASTINSIALDSSGTLFVGGIDRKNLGVVWKYTYPDWKHLPTIPAAQNIMSIAFDKNNTLYAAGSGSDNSGHVWVFNSQSNTWDTLPMSKNNGVHAIAFDGNNTLYALGSNLQYVPQVWAHP